jgi:hypothetical protein
MNPTNRQDISTPPRLKMPCSLCVSRLQPHPFQEGPLIDTKLKLFKMEMGPRIGCSNPAKTQSSVSNSRFLLLRSPEGLALEVDRLASSLVLMTVDLLGFPARQLTARVPGSLSGTPAGDAERQ